MNISSALCFTYSNSAVVPGSTLDELLGKVTRNVPVLYSRGAMTAIGIGVVVGIHVVIVGPFYAQSLVRVMKSGWIGSVFDRFDMFVCALINAVTIACVVLAWALVDKYSIATLFWPYHCSVSQIIGILIGVAGDIFICLAHIAMGAVWRPMVTDLSRSQDNKLITGGVFRFARHPIYLGFLLFAIGACLIVESWLATIPLLAMPCWFVFYRIPREEALMRRQFGREYAAYSKHVGMLLPFSCRVHDMPMQDEADNDDEGFATCKE